MNRRHFATTCISALVGTSAIPAFGEKPKLRMIVGVDSSFGKDSSVFGVSWYDAHAGEWVHETLQSFQRRKFAL